MNDERTLDELYADYAEFLKNDPEEQKIQQAMKERRAERERNRVEDEETI